ncbi:hypothetical protein AB4Z25_18430 [Rhizobium sp. RAF36]|uniref:hypothetical protein n=1 Tax=Rhizobium sp. RAF36 TaxID=3233055 RepID=UPI003F99E003
MVEPREHRIHMYLSEEEKEAIDDWRFKNRIATRSDAIRRLCQIGLAVGDEMEGMVQAAEQIFITIPVELMREISDSPKKDSDTLLKIYKAWDERMTKPAGELHDTLLILSQVAKAITFKEDIEDAKRIAKERLDLLAELRERNPR